MHDGVDAEVTALMLPRKQNVIRTSSACTTHSLILNVLGKLAPCIGAVSAEAICMPLLTQLCAMVMMRQQDSF